MDVTIFLSDKVRLDRPGEAVEFLQRLANRIAVGKVRYGNRAASKKYLSRLEVEVKAYKRTRNQEHLYNAAVYCFLEMSCPEDGGRGHFNPEVGSATRGIFGGQHEGD